MSPPKLNEAEIFDMVRRIDSPEGRRLCIQQTCGQDQPLQARVAALIRVYEEQDGFLESLPDTIGFIRSDPIRGAIGSQIGPYKLIEEIGEGGFGVVFKAEQTQPLRRTVALKIIKPGMDTCQVIARFQAERQALALMDHPNIAKVLDAGTTNPKSEARNSKPNSNRIEPIRNSALRNWDLFRISVFLLRICPPAGLISSWS